MNSLVFPGGAVLLLAWLAIMVEWYGYRTGNVWHGGFRVAGGGVSGTLLVVGAGRAYLGTMLEFCKGVEVTLLLVKVIVTMRIGAKR